MFRTVAAVLGFALLQLPGAPQALAGQSIKTSIRQAPLPSATASDLRLGSSAFAIAHQETGEILVERRGEVVLPIASITKLMTAMVVLDAGQSLSETLTVTRADIDTLKGTGSRLPIGARMTREQMLLLALMSSENRAASALARHYPGGEKAFVAAMNVKARLIGLDATRFYDSTGLDPRNVSNPRDLVRMVSAASAYPLIREFSTSDDRQVRIGKSTLQYRNSNSLVRSPEWQIGLSKTGFIREAGRCLVMQTWLKGEPVIIVLMNANDRSTRSTDAVRVKQWLETGGLSRVALSAGRRDG
ncbi:peptidase S11 [Pseudothauera nasutitermitis]|uniref:Peptidase S11 n=2 Tax=Pseudothauera nasutitermitis TaxID=2565930 RepID=A0A4S4ATF5_9RHOO|nr:peptidase S11 [Pseudothauera nasutitermitis]